MSHEIEMKKDGSASMFYVKEVPWHGLGQMVEKEVTAAAAIRFAQLDWECEKQPLYLSGMQKVDDIPVIGQEVTDRKAVVRTSDNSILGIVSNNYHIINNAECFDFMDSLIGEGQAVYHTAGSLYNGKVIFLTVKLPGSAQVGPDKIDKYLLLSSSHDGTLALSVRWTPIRVVCANTLNFANENCSQTIRIRHSQNYQDKIKEARQVLELTEVYYKELEKTFDRLLNTPYTMDEMGEFVAKLFPSEKEEIPTQTINRRNTVYQLFQDGTGIEPVKNTQWAAYNAVTEYVDHVANYRKGQVSSAEESRMNSVFFGGGSSLKNKALELLTA